MIGASLAHYRITSKLGEGGMGAVYRATDTKLGRDVAIKVLPPSLANDADYIARFQREAQVLASLNHPNIAAIYGLEDNAIVMELVEGVELKGPLPLDEAVRIAKQIADALEAAHERGIIHRDLKPANIKITADGTVKVLDFGLAKATEPAKADSASAANSPTLTLHATQAGMILGTAAYMAPEQAAGKPVDRRADIWAFGVVLWEMITGWQLFEGETISHTLAAVLKDPIDFSPLPAGRVRTLVERCLHRDPKQRLQWIGEARIALQQPFEPPSSVQPASARSAWFVPMAVGVLATALIAGGLAWTLWPRSEPPEPAVFSLQPPPETWGSGGAISPNGRMIAITLFGRQYGTGAVFLRSLEAPEPRLLPGTEGSNNIVSWSPDSKSIAFTAGGRLKTLSLESGAIDVLASEASGNPLWLSSEWILFSHRSTRLLYKIPPGGGAPEIVVPADETRGEVRQAFPTDLRDGNRFLYVSTATREPGIYMASIDGMKPKLILPRAEGVQYAEAASGRGGYLLYNGDTHLLARRFDRERGELSGESFAVAPATGDFAVEKDRLLYRPQLRPTGGLRWSDRSGDRIGDAVGLSSPVLSPDNRRAAAVRTGGEIWVIDLERGSSTRVTSDGGGYMHPVWSPDGKRLAYGGSAPFRIEVRDAGGGGQSETLLQSKVAVRPLHWSPDGTWLLYMSGFRGRWDLYGLPLSGERKPVPILVDTFDKYAARLAPDGRWLAYCSNETGRMEVYVVPVPATLPGGQALTGRWQISTRGGSHPIWRSDGKSLFFQDARDIMEVPVQTSPQGVTAGTPVKRSESALVTGPPYFYDVSKDGKRFLLLEGADEVRQPLMFMLNWQSRLKK